MGLNRGRNYAKMAKKATAAKPMKKVIKKAVAKAKVNNIKKIVNSVLKSKNELKIAQNLTLAENIGITGTGLLYNPVGAQYRGWSSGFNTPGGVIPLISAGTGESDRIGNVVQPKTNIIKYFLTALPTTDGTYTSGGVVANSNPFRGVPFRVRVIVYRHKYANDDWSQGNLLQTGNTTSGFGSAMDNFFRPYNRDEYTIVYSKTIRMAASKHNSGAAGVNSVPENSINGALSFYSGNIKVPCPKTLKYNDGANIPTNTGFFMAVCYCNEDGQIDNTSVYTRLSINAECQMTYYDD